MYIPLSTDFIYGMQGIAFNRLDYGMYLRDACKIVKEYGDTTYKSINTNTEQPKCTEKLKATLTELHYEEAKSYKIKSYAKCEGANALRLALMNYGPVLACIKWYEKYNFSDGTINFDKTSDYSYHAIMVCGWNEQGWICQNSWGRAWNKGGRFTFPYQEKFVEVWSLIDAKSEDIVKPITNNFIKKLCKILNAILNFLRH
jgi:C1A family cysteine protease